MLFGAVYWALVRFMYIHLERNSKPTVWLWLLIEDRIVVYSIIEVFEFAYYFL